MKSLLLVEAAMRTVPPLAKLPAPPLNKLTPVFVRVPLLLLSPPLEIELHPSPPLTVSLLPVPTLIIVALRLVHVNIIGHPLPSGRQRVLVLLLCRQQSLKGRLARIIVALPLRILSILTRLLVGTIALLVVGTPLVVHSLKTMSRILLPTLNLNPLLRLTIPLRSTRIPRCLPQKFAEALAILILRLVQASLVAPGLAPRITLLGVRALATLHPLRHRSASNVPLSLLAATALIIVFPLVWSALLSAQTLLVV